MIHNADKHMIRQNRKRKIIKKTWLLSHLTLLCSTITSLARLLYNHIKGQNLEIQQFTSQKPTVRIQ